MAKKTESYIGRTFGYIKITKGPFYKIASGMQRTFWGGVCQYKNCGNYKLYRQDSLYSGKSTSCNCYQKSLLTTHGKTNTSEFRIWSNIKNRCLNPKDKDWENYGGRGIVVAPEFTGENGFINFYKEVGPRPTSKYTIDRKNNNKGYEPGNLRWATWVEQNNNHRYPKKKSDAHSSKYLGVFFNKKIGKYQARVYKKGKFIHVGAFNDEIKAAKARDKEALKYYEVKFIRLNFPV